MKKRITFLVIPKLFERYIIVVDPMDGTTSVFCEECETWVTQFEGDHITTHTPEDLLGKIVDDHEQHFPTLVEFDDETVTFK